MTRRLTSSVLDYRSRNNGDGYMDVSKSSYYIHPTCYTVPEQYQSCHPVRIFSFIFKSVLVDYVAGDSDCDSYFEKCGNGGRYRGDGPDGGDDWWQC